MKKQVRNDIVARADDAFKSSSYAEYSVAKKVEGKYKTQRLLMIALYVGIVVGGIALFAILSNVLSGMIGLVGIFLIALVPLAVWMMVYFTWGKVSIEYKYVIDHSEMTFYTLYGRKEVKTFNCKVKDLELIAPLNDEYKGQLEAFKADTTIEAVPSLSDYDIYFALHTDESGKKTAILFQVTEYSLKALKYYNKAALVVTETMR